MSISMQGYPTTVSYHFCMFIASTYVCYAYLGYELIVLVTNNGYNLLYCDMCWLGCVE